VGVKAELPAKKGIPMLQVCPFLLLKPLLVLAAELLVLGGVTPISREQVV
jgi:hypothetical protein